MKKRYHPMFYVIISLTGFGLVWMLLFNTQELLKNVLYLGLAVLIIWGIYHFLFRKNRYPSASSGYQRAYRSASSNREATARSVFPPVRSDKALTKGKKKGDTLKKKTRKHNFTVIEGNKGKRKI